jgi:hypothetical protein
MKTNRIASMLALAMVACGGPVSSGADAFGQGRDTAAKGGGGRFEMGANSLFFNPNPAQGEVSLSGFVVVTLGSISTGSFIPPTDTVVTANGVALLRDPALNGAYYRVDPAGPQPQIGANGQLTLIASSASAGISRSLVLPCAGDETIVANPPEGSSLTGVDSLALSWSASLSAHVTSLPVQENVQALLFGYDPDTGTLGNAVDMIPVAGTLGTSLAVHPTTSPAYAAEVLWPGQYRLDGQSGGQCGRVERLVFAR